MSNGVVSRRAVLPTLVGGAVSGAAVLALADRSEADPKRLVPFEAVAGPASLVAGQTLVSSLFLPAVQKNALPAVQFELRLFTLDGKLIGTDRYSLALGQGAATTLQIMGDGSAQLNGQAIDLTVSPGTQVSIIAVLIGLLLPAVQLPNVTLQCSNNFAAQTGAAIGLGAVTYILPFITPRNSSFADGSV